MMQHFGGKKKTQWNDGSPLKLQDYYYHFIIISFVWTGRVHNKTLTLYLTRRDALQQVAIFHL